MTGANAGSEDGFDAGFADGFADVLRGFAAEAAGGSADSVAGGPATSPGTSAGTSADGAADGSAAGCSHSPANRFEEEPPLAHRQRVEIHSGCDALCTACNHRPVAAPNDHISVTAWIDCSDCSDIAQDLDRAAHQPTMQRCLGADPALDSVYYGFTGGFPGGAPAQAVTLGRLILRSD